MGLINEAKEFYKDSYLLIIMNITYYIHYFLCLLYLCWYPYYIISNIKEFANENYINYYLIFYSFYTINAFVKEKKNINYDIIFSILFLGFIFMDIINKNTIHSIQYWILYNILISIFIFVYGTLYLIFKLDFDRYNIDIDKSSYIAEIVSEAV
jgi:hypothetical protein